MATCMVSKQRAVNVAVAKMIERARSRAIVVRFPAVVICCVPELLRASSLRAVDLSAERAIERASMISVALVLVMRTSRPNASNVALRARVGASHPSKLQIVQREGNTASELLYLIVNRKLGEIDRDP